MVCGTDARNAKNDNMVKICAEQKRLVILKVNASQLNIARFMIFLRSVPAKATTSIFIGDALSG